MLSDDDGDDNEKNNNSPTVIWLFRKHISAKTNEPCMTKQKSYNNKNKYTSVVRLRAMNGNSAVAATGDSGDRTMRKRSDGIK